MFAASPVAESTSGSEGSVPSAKMTEAESSPSLEASGLEYGLSEKLPGVANSRVAN